MQVVKQILTDALVLQPNVFKDERGFFLESYNQNAFEKIVQKKIFFVQDNHSKSIQNVLRGLHYQQTYPQGKLVRVVSGHVFDVVVDLRKKSKTFGQHFGVELSATNQLQFWIPEGFAHGFLVLSETAELLYKVTDFYHPESDRTLRWNDPDLKISWPIQQTPLLSPKDQKGISFQEAEKFL